MLVKIASKDSEAVVNALIKHAGKLNAIARRVNERPRKTLDFDTPAERFQQAVALTG